MNFSREQVNNLFPNLHGRGKELREICTTPTQFDRKMDEAKFPEYVKEMVFNNFIAPLTVDGITEEETKKVVSRLDLFCASIL